MSLIILGGSGFLGNSLVNKLKEREIPFRLMLHKKIIDEKDCFFGDCTKKEFLDDHVSDNDIIINLVGQQNGDLFEENIKTAVNLLNSAIKKKNIRIIFASSIEAYGETSFKASGENELPKPFSQYGIIKLLAENIYRTFSELFELDITILRFSNIYGNGKKIGIIWKSIEAMKKQKSITIDQNGEQKRDFLFIDDAIDGILRTIATPLSGFNIINISSGKGIEINQIMEIIEKVSKKKIPKIVTNNKSNSNYIVANNSKAKKILNFTPNTDINLGIKKTIDSKTV
jgi:nucleoside-diphosphate-sugar epimerase